MVSGMGFAKNEPGERLRCFKLLPTQTEFVTQGLEGFLPLERIVSQVGQETGAKIAERK